MSDGLSREVEIDSQHAALLFIDVQNYTARHDGGSYKSLSEHEIEERQRTTAELAAEIERLI